MTPRLAIALASAGSALLLLGAFAFQYLGGFPPCEMCIWQRYPHVVAVAIGLIALRLNRTVLSALGALAAFTTAAVGAFHVGVEQGWWEGPTSCSAGSVGGISADDLLDQIMAAPLVRCDDIAWEMIGISMAGWNALISLGLVALWLVALRRG